MAIAPPPEKKNTWNLKRKDTHAIYFVEFSEIVAGSPTFSSQQKVIRGVIKILIKVAPTPRKRSMPFFSAYFI